MRKVFQLILFVVLWIGTAASQTAVVTRNVNLRSDPSTDNPPVTKLLPGAHLKLVEPDATGGYYHVRTEDSTAGYVWGRNIQISSSEAPTSTPTGSTATTTTSSSTTPTAFPSNTPLPLLTKGHPVDWWFVFKFNSAKFPGCGASAAPACPFGGSVQSYPASSQQFVYASSEDHVLHKGSNCVGDSTDDPLGATFDEVYNGSYYYLIWNDQFYQDPPIRGCSGNSCSAPWGHSKGLLAWNDAGDGFVLQVTTPSWPASGSKQHARQSDGNTLGCIAGDNDIQVSQHFFALRLTKDDVLKVMRALSNASVVTDPSNLQIVKSGGPADIQAIAKTLGKKSSGKTSTKDVLSTGVVLISKPSNLNVPPWQLVSAILGGIPLRTATWWASPKIDSTTTSSTITCWDNSVGQPGDVEVATTGQWSGTTFALVGGPGYDSNHAKFAVSTAAGHPLSIFGDMNQQGTLTGTNCSRSQNGRGGLFYVINDSTLTQSLTELLQGDTAPTAP